MRYELTLMTLDEDYVDTLVIALARQGYSPYISDDAVCIQVGDEELVEIDAK